MLNLNKERIYNKKSFHRPKTASNTAHKVQTKSASVYHSRQNSTPYVNDYRENRKLNDLLIGKCDPEIAFTGFYDGTKDYFQVYKKKKKSTSTYDNCSWLAKKFNKAHGLTDSLKFQKKN